MSIFNKSAVLEGFKALGKDMLTPVVVFAAPVAVIVTAALALATMPVENSNCEFFKKALFNYPNRWNNKNTKGEREPPRPKAPLVQAKRNMRNAID